MPGTRWITGANEHGKHVFDLVAGRDFTADGTVEAAEVRAGDPAPDGSGPLELARGIEIGHIFALGRKYAQALGLTVLDQNGKAQVVTMGSYGIGVTRVLAALAEANNDERGLAWPAHVAPAHVHVVATGKDPAVFEAADAIATELSSRGVEVLYDDRPGKVSPGVKFADAELLGVPLVVVVGRGLAEGVVEVRPRVGGTTEQVPVAEAADRVGRSACVDGRLLGRLTQHARRPSIGAGDRMLGRRGRRGVSRRLLGALREARERDRGGAPRGGVGRSPRRRPVDQRRPAPGAGLRDGVRVRVGDGGLERARRGRSRRSGRRARRAACTTRGAGPARSRRSRRRPPSPRCGRGARRRRRAAAARWSPESLAAITSNP